MGAFIHGMQQNLHAIISVFLLRSSMFVVLILLFAPIPNIVPVTGYKCSGLNPYDQNDWCFTIYFLCNSTEHCKLESPYHEEGGNEVSSQTLVKIIHCTKHGPGCRLLTFDYSDTIGTGVACCCNQTDYCNNETSYPAMNASEYLYKHYFPVCLNDTKWNTSASAYQTQHTTDCLNRTDDLWHEWNHNYWCYDRYDNHKGTAGHRRSCVNKTIDTECRDKCSKEGEDTYLCCCKGQQCNANMSAFEFYMNTTTTTSTTLTSSTTTTTTTRETSPTETNTTEASTTLLTSQAISTTSTTPSTTTTSVKTSTFSSTTESSTGLSGLYIALIVGGSILFLVALFLIFLCCLRRRRRNEGPPSYTVTSVVPEPSSQTDDSITAEERSLETEPIMMSTRSGSNHSSTASFSISSHMRSLFHEYHNYLPRPKRPEHVPAKHAQPPIQMPAKKAKSPKRRVSFSRFHNKTYGVSGRELDSSVVNYNSRRASMRSVQSDLRAERD